MSGATKHPGRSHRTGEAYSHVGPPISLRFASGYETTKEKREAERRQTLAVTCRAAGTAAAPLHILPRMRGRIKEGAARLSAFHRGSDVRAFARCARLQARLPGTRQERRSVTFPLPGAASDAVVAGVTRPNLSQSSGSTPPTGRNAGLLMPKAARERNVSFRARAPHSLRTIESTLAMASLT